VPNSDAPPPSTGQQLYEAGWCQGAILPVEVAVRIRPATVPEHYQHAVLITQDCNIVADDDKEPQVEIAFGYCAQAGENVNAFAQGKNPRRFLTVIVSDVHLVWDVRHRQSIPKSVLHTELGTAKPLGRLLDADLREFRAWLGRRYSRPAFPDTFNERLRPAMSAIDKAVKSEGFRSVRAVFYWIIERDEELPEAEPYHLQIIFCFAHNGTASPLPQAATEIDKFAKAVAACPGIELTKHEALSDLRFPIQYLDVWEGVDFDARSYGSSESAPPRI
jgi:hypothetical protein